MRIEKVQLKNIGLHADLHIELSSGLVGVLGANGSGKSTLINSIYAALTNDFSRFGGTKSDVIKNDCGKEQSFVEIAGVHRNQQFTLTRWLKPNKNKLVIGNKEYTKANEVNEAIEGELNIPKAIIDKYVFVKQWDMFSFLSQTASERAKTFQHLCGIDVASKIHQACNDYVRNTPSVIADNSLELTEQIEWHQTRLAELSAEWEADEKRQVEDAVIEAAHALLKNKDDCDAALEFVTTKTPELEEIQASIAKYKGQYTLAKETRAFLLEEVRKTKEHPLYPWTRKYTALRRLHADIKDIKKRLKQLAEEEHVAIDEMLEFSEEDSERIEEIDTRREELLALKGLEAHFADFSKENFTRGEECPTCKQLVDKHHIEQICSEIDERHQEIIKLQAELEELEDLRKGQELATEKYTSAVDAYAKTKKQLHRHEAKLPKGEVSLEEVLELKNHVSDLRAELKKNSKDRILGYREMVRELRKQEKKLAAEIQEKRDLVVLTPHADDVMKASDLIEEQQELANHLTMLERVESEINFSLTGLKSTLADLKARLAEQAKIQNLMATVTAAGDLFYWNNLPKIVAQSNMEMLVDDINENLGLFNNPFFVEASDDLTFRVYFPGKPPVKASQLSGGQKVVLAIAFRAALDRVFGHDAGMMFLDEPTAGLDADNIAYFHDALSQLSSKTTENRQMVVITHVQELGGVFDQVVEV